MLKIFSLSNIALATLFTLSAQWAVAWGERGHHIIGYTAARLTESLATPQEQEKLGQYYSQRPFVMGHLSNIPDTSWRAPHRKIVTQLNASTHYFDAEFILGAPGDSISDYQNKIRNLDTDSHRFLSLYNNKPNIFTNKKEDVVRVFDDVGIAPFRVQQLYKKMLEALKCAKSKEKLKSKNNHIYKQPIFLGNYNCTPKSTFLEDLSAAIQIGGVMGHFVGDLSQPLHTSANFDAQFDGQGGLHEYFETSALHEIDESLLNDVVNLARSRDFQKALWDRLQLNPKESIEPTKAMFHLVADSFGNLQKLLDLDRKYALIAEGTRAKTNEKYIKKSVKDAIRRPANSKTVTEGFRPFIVERLATSSLLLSRLWLQAWRTAGEPDTRKVGLIEIPYPLDVPFILPSEEFTQDHLKKLKRAQLQREL